MHSNRATDEMSLLLRGRTPLCGEVKPGSSYLLHELRETFGHKMQIEE